MAVAAVVIVIRVAVAVAVIIMAVAVMAPKKGSGENLKKSSPRRKERFPSGFLTRDGARVRVIGTPIDISPA